MESLIADFVQYSWTIASLLFFERGLGIRLCLRFFFFEFLLKLLHFLRLQVLSCETGRETSREVTRTLNLW